MIGLAIIGFLVFLLLDKPASTNVINLIQIISWPIVILITLLLLHRPLSRFIESLGGPNVQTFKVSVLQFGLELSKASASKFTPHWADTSNDLDLRLTAADELISNIPSLFDQFKDTTSLDYALIDIGNGDKWLTSRLFIFAIMLERMRGLRCLVFVETTSEGRQCFLGIASPIQLRWKLAMRYPWLESAFTQALGNLPPPVLSVHGAIDPELARSIVRQFLDNPVIQSKTPPSPDDDWATITRTKKPAFWEHANWIDRTWIHKQVDIINSRAYRKSNTQDSPTTQTQYPLNNSGEPALHWN